jgi:hypothetical protein
METEHESAVSTEHLLLIVIVLVEPYEERLHPESERGVGVLA